jgi:putative transposase
LQGGDGGGILSNFTLKQMLAFLRQAVERKYQVVEGIYLPSG